MTPVTATTDVTLRPIGPADAPFLLRVYSSTRAEELARVPWTDDQKSTFLRQQFEVQHTYWSQHYPDAEFSVVELDGEPVGRFYVDRGADEIRLVDIALLPEHRREGLGTLLLRGLIAEARSAGLPITIHVEVFNPARAFYERLGFAKVADRGVYLLMQWRPDGERAAVS